MKPDYLGLQRLAYRLGIALRLHEPKGGFAANFEKNPDNSVLKHRANIFVSSTTLLKNPARARKDFSRRVAHELAHYLIAPPERRDETNFGLSFQDAWEDRKPEEELRAQEATAHILNFYHIPFNDREVFTGCLAFGFLKGHKQFKKKFPQIEIWWNQYGRQYIDGVLNF